MEMEGSYLCIGNRTDYIALAAVGISYWIRDLIWHNAVCCVGGYFPLQRKHLVECFPLFNCMYNYLVKI